MPQLQNDQGCTVLPQFVVRRGESDGGGGAVRGINWIFNSWGEKNVAWDRDNRVAASILRHAGVEKVDNPFVLEGGSIHVDGEGCVSGHL